MSTANSKITKLSAKIERIIKSFMRIMVAQLLSYLINEAQNGEKVILGFFLAN